MDYIDELISELNKCTYFDSIDNFLFNNRQKIKENNLVVVYGCSDDLIEFDGYFSDEADVYVGGDVYINKTGISNNIDKSAKITAIWCDNNSEYCWTYKTNIPHMTFHLNEEDGNKYCEGIVFNINDL